MSKCAAQDDGGSSSSDSDEDFGPQPIAPPSKKQRKQKILHNIDVFLRALPDQGMYEKSVMHREVVHRICTSHEHNFVMAGRTDGVLRFWLN